MSVREHRASGGRRLAVACGVAAVVLGGCASAEETVAAEGPVATVAPATTVDESGRMTDEEVMAQALAMAEERSELPVAGIEWVRVAAVSEALRLHWPGLYLSPEEDVPVIYFEADGEFVDPFGDPLRPDMPETRTRYYYGSFMEDGTVMGGGLTDDDVDLSVLGAVTRGVPG